MTAINFEVLPQSLFPVFMEEELRSYTDPRPGVLESIDIFEEGQRSEGYPSNFSLFKESQSADVLVFPFYLELFEFFGKSQILPPLLIGFCAANPNKLIVSQWNHDIDFAKRFPSLGNINNLRVLNFNTSKKSSNDIILPFWTVDTNPVEAPKEYTYGFVGEITHPIRATLANTFRDDPTCYMGAKLEYQQFRRTLSSCRFSFCPRGVGLGSWRFFECMHLNTIPVLFADEVELPYPDLDYTKFCVRLPESATRDKYLIEHSVRSVDEEQMLLNLKEVRHRFTLKGVQEEVYKCLLNP